MNETSRWQVDEQVVKEWWDSVKGKGMDSMWSGAVAGTDWDELVDDAKDEISQICDLAVKIYLRPNRFHVEQYENN